MYYCLKLFKNKANLNGNGDDMYQGYRVVIIVCMYASGMLMMGIIIAGYLEGKAIISGEVFWNSEKPEGYVPGNYGFDPLGLYTKRGDKMTMETAEIKNGRLAMIAISAFAFQECATGLPVVQETPYCF